MSDISRTTVSISEINTPILNANEAHIGKLSLSNVENLQAKTGYIENLTIKELTVLEDDAEGSNENSETYENVEFNDVTLDFSDHYNNVYLLADDTVLINEEDCKMLTINFDIPTEMGSKLVCRYLVLDLRKASIDDVVAVTWPTKPIHWLYGVPDIQAGYFYVLSFQRFAKDLIIGNVSVKIAG